MPQRSGLYFMILGFALAVVTGVLVLRIGAQAVEASKSGIRMTDVVVANRSILDRSAITPDAVAVKSFPVELVPPGAFSTRDAAVGKYARGFIAKGQVVVTDQLATTPTSRTLSDRVPAGRVAIWLPMPPVLASASILKPGDHVDILLSLTLSSGGGPQDCVSSQSTQS